MFIFQKNINCYKYFINSANKNKLNVIIIIVFIILIFFSINSNRNNENVKNHYQKDELTIVSAYFKIKSKHKPRQYLDWLKNFVLLNKSIVFFTNKKFMPHLKAMRPKELFNKTVFIEVEIGDFYSYKNFYKDFQKSFMIDSENKYHTTVLYMIWAEKCNFLKKAVIDKKSEIKKYLNNWPSTKKCFQDKRLLMGQVNNFTLLDKEKILNFDKEAHLKLKKNLNVIGGIFGGQRKNILKFVEYYYETVKLYIKNKLFIGKDQNIFTYVAFAHPEVVKLIFCKDFFEYREHIS